MTKKKGVTEAYLDQIFSNYIRLRDADGEGFIKCCECGKYFWWKESTCGHFIKRQHRTLRWDERNRHAQCAPCNGKDANIMYASFMVERYGKEIWQTLNTEKNRAYKPLPAERKDMVDYYGHKVKQLRKEKGL